jgi:hypothetical protein
MGKKTQIILDDFFPYDKAGKAWKFAKTDQNEIWVLLLEKAWAKICGTYAKTIAGHTGDALRTLTGAPTQIFKHHEFERDMEGFWNTIYDADKNNNIMCCSMGDAGNEEGLVSNHAYTLVGAYEVSEEENPDNKYRIVRIRNPWGQGDEPEKDWGDDSENWNNICKETKTEVGFTKAKDGCFFLSIDQF